MKPGRPPSAANSPTKLCILLMDGNSERRALRTKIMALHGVEIVGAANLTEAGSVWNPERYDMVLIDIRRDYRGCLAWRNEIKKERPDQVVAFLVGRPQYVDLSPLENSYVAEESGTQWGDSLRQAVHKSCESLDQRNGLTEAIWRIIASRKINRATTISTAPDSARPSFNLVPVPTVEASAPLSIASNAGPTFLSDAEGLGLPVHENPMENK